MRKSAASNHPSAPAVRSGHRGVLLAALAVVSASALLGGCRTSAQNGALIGAGAGALGGYVIGNEHDKK